MIRIDNLCKSFGDFCAVDHLSFEVAEGEIFGFIGPNGAGKTTTIKIMTTLLEPDQGSINIDGHCVFSEPEKVRGVIGYMPDYFGVYENVTIAEYLDFFALAYHLPRQRRSGIIQDCMQLTDLDKIADKLVSSLSKGMKQRLCLAKTLLHDPRVLILDEPAAGLDPRARIEFRALIKELQNLGKTILLSSHILKELSELITSMAIIEHGKLVVAGSIDTLAKSFLKIRIFGQEHTERAASLLQESEYIAQVTQVEQWLEVEYNGDDSEIYEVIKVLVNAAIPVVEFAKAQNNLEDIFMQVTKGDMQ